MRVADFQRRMTVTIHGLPQQVEAALTLAAEHAGIEAYMRSWLDRWCPARLDPLSRWHREFAASTCQLTLLCRLAKAATSVPATIETTSAVRDAIIRHSQRLFARALDHPMSLHMLGYSMTFPFAATLLLNGTVKNATLPITRVALRMVGDPNHRQISTFIRNNGLQLLSILW